jgi:hypothetical protein
MRITVMALAFLIAPMCAAAQAPGQGQARVDVQAPEPIMPSAEEQTAEETRARETCRAARRTESRLSSRRRPACASAPQRTTPTQESASAPSSSDTATEPDAEEAPAPAPAEQPQ